MDLLNLIFLKLFLVLLFLNSYVDARYPFVSSQYIKYKNNVAKRCGSMTFIPLYPQKIYTKNDENPFRGSVARKREEELQENCIKMLKENSGSKYFFDSGIAQQLLHDVSYLCAKNDECEDLKSEVNLNTFWDRLIKSNTLEETGISPQTCDQTYSKDGIYTSDCPFSTRIDLLHYVFHNEEKHRNKLQTNDDELCVDRYGRKYPPPEGLGGKCVMFQHELRYQNGTATTEFFMPIEKRDLVQQLSQYKYDHAIRNKTDVIERLLPLNADAAVNISNCMTMYILKETFIHCVYDPEDSEKFHPKSSTDFFCPKETSRKRLFLAIPKNKHTIENLREASITYDNISDNKFVLSEDCFISTQFTPRFLFEEIKVGLNAKFVGGNQSKCRPEQIIEAGSSQQAFGQKHIQSIEDFCPWENSNKYTICLKTKSKNYFSSYVEAVNKIKRELRFKLCYYQVNSKVQSEKHFGCYYQINAEDGSRSRISPRWIPLIESGELAATKTDYKEKEGCGIVFITKEMKAECSKKAAKQRIQYSSSGTNEIICKCKSRLCDQPATTNEAELVAYKNAVVCNQGSSEMTLPSPFFFCFVHLNLVAEHGKKVKHFQYSYIDPNVNTTINHTTCWTYQNLTAILDDPEAEETDVGTSCWHNHETQIYECCCLASDTPCNTHHLIDAYYELANQAAEETFNRIEYGCKFNAEVSSATTETCAAKEVRNDREMRCYGVFEIPSTGKDGKAKPTLVKENCYWPHPQYHDEYSIFCSKQFFEIDDLVEDKCISLYIKDYTSMKNKSERTMVLCCNAGVYPDKRESILSRSIVVL